MKKIKIDALDSLLYCLNENNQVFWIRNQDYSKQIYVSPSFETIWETPCGTLYDNPAMFTETVIPDEYSDYILGADDKRKNLENLESDKSELIKPLWRIKTSSGRIKYIYDSPMMLVDANGEHIGFCGVGGELPEEKWLDLYFSQENKLNLENTVGYRENILSNLERYNQMKASELDLNRKKEKPFLIVNGTTEKIPITRREAQCLVYLRQGNTAKQIAIKLFLSYRTVETHLKNLKEKVECRTSIELLSKVRIPYEII
jgi:DNA-binding CsgD family transcriptional regulator